MFTRLIMLLLENDACERKCEVNRHITEADENRAKVARRSISNRLYQ